MPAFIALLFVVLFIFAPLIFIWALNTLFALHIAFGVAEYFAALVVLGAIGGIKFKFNNK